MPDSLFSLVRRPFARVIKQTGGVLTLAAGLLAQVAMALAERSQTATEEIVDQNEVECKGMKLMENAGIEQSPLRRQILVPA